MAENLTIQSPDFERVRSETGTATYDAIRLLWTTLNYEADLRRRGVNAATRSQQPLSMILDPSGTQNNFDTGDASVLVLNGATGRTFTGFLAPSADRTKILWVHVTGAGTYTLANNSGSSDAANRIRSASGSDISLATDQSAVLIYLGTLWRQLNN